MDRKIAVIAIGIAIALVAGVISYQIIANMFCFADKSTVAVSPRIPAAPSTPEPVTDMAHDAAVSDSPSTESEYWKLASFYENRQDLLKLKDIYRTIIEKFPSSASVLKAQEALENNNVKLLFSGIATPDSFIYEVQKGDSLFKIAKKFATTVELISKANGLKGAVLRAGKKLKITKLKFSIIVDKSQNILTLKADGDIFKTYRVATGKNNSTPVGTFKVTNKIIDPPWYPPQGKVIPPGDPKNVLGTRWLGISKPSYGIHGTIDPGSIGRNVTEGCVRMKNEEVEEIFAIVTEGTEVVIID